MLGQPTTTTPLFQNPTQNPGQNTLQMTFGPGGNTNMQPNLFAGQNQNQANAFFQGQPQANQPQANMFQPMAANPQGNFNPQFSNTSLRAFTATHNQENELQMVFNNFMTAINVPNKDSLFKCPVYNEIPPNIHPNTFATYTYIPDMDVNTWEQNYRANPNPHKFYVDQVRGVEELSRRFAGRIEGFQTLNQQMLLHQKKVDELKNQAASQISERIKEIKKKNGVLLDKILNVHNLIEKISIKYNHFERNTNEEANVMKKITELEALVYDSHTKINDIKLNFLEKLNLEEVEKQNSELNSNISSSEIEERKKKTLLFLEQMKQGIEILQNVSQRDFKEFKTFQDFIEKHKY